MDDVEKEQQHSMVNSNIIDSNFLERTDGTIDVVTTGVEETIGLSDKFANIMCKSYISTSLI